MWDVRWIASTSGAVTKVADNWATIVNALITIQKRADVYPAAVRETATGLSNQLLDRNFLAIFFYQRDVIQVRL